MSDYIPMSLPNAILSLKEDRQFSCDSDLRKEIMNEWLAYAKMQSRKGNELLEEGSKYEKCIQALTEWKKVKAHQISKSRLSVVSEKLKQILWFAVQIDQEKSLLEMLFRKINASELLLIIMSVQPNEHYLDLCAKRYAL